MNRPASASAFLDADIVVRRSGHIVNIALTAEPGDVVAVIGPNGAGKSTLLRALAGLLPLDEGAISCAGDTWDGPATKTPWTPQERNIGMVFGQHLLFPHLDALDNVAFGPRSRGAGRGDSRRTAHRWLETIGVADLARRKPHELSGGQAQRVAIARALATDPTLLLLDEPMAALDVGVAMALRFELARHLAEFGGVSILVTHDAIDTMTVANRVVVLDEGAIAQVGTPLEVAQRPRTEHVARLVGINVLRGHSTGTDVRLVDGSGLVSTTPFNGQVFASFQPAAVALTLDEPTGSARNRWPGTVRSVVAHGAAVRVHIDAGAALIADVTPASAAELSLVPGRQVWAAVKATEVTVYGTGADNSEAPLPSRHV